MARFIRLLTLLALLLMPLAMAPAAQAHSTAAAHCSDQMPKPDSKHQATECAMPCSAALPATMTPTIQHAAIVHVAAQVSLLPMLRGIHRDIATPPPRGF